MTMDKKACVLVADADEETGLAVERALLERGCSVVRSRRFDEAERLAQALRPEVVVVAAFLLDGNCVELVQALRRREGVPFPKVIVIAPETHHLTITMLIGSDVAAVLRQPVAAAELALACDGSFKRAAARPA